MVLHWKFHQSMTTLQYRKKIWYGLDNQECNIDYTFILAILLDRNFVRLTHLMEDGYVGISNMWFGDISTIQVCGQNENSCFRNKGSNDDGDMGNKIEYKLYKTM